MKEIEEIIFQEGYRNNNGNRLSHTTMSNIITNPKYKGYFVGGKVKVIDIFNKRQKFLPEDEWLMSRLWSVRSYGKRPMKYLSGGALT